MPSHYLYYCTNGHEEMRYRNAQKCRICGAEVDRRDAPTPDLSTLERYQKLQEEHAALLAEVERLQRERAEWCDRADALMTEQMTQMRDLTAEVEALRARLTLTPEKARRLADALAEALDTGGWTMVEDITNDQYCRIVEHALRPALLAAGMEEKA